MGAGNILTIIIVARNANGTCHKTNGQYAGQNLSFYQVEKDVNFAEYQEKAKQTAKYPVIGHGVIYPTLGLTNEAGEVAGKIKKIFRDREGLIGETELAALKGELGDVLWYLAQVSTELGLSLDEIADNNIAKLMDRQRRGKIQGDGDNR
jgi:NTP pyrophosphatase (non-canonical NTP hydrolase)